MKRWVLSALVLAAAAAVAGGCNEEIIYGDPNPWDETPEWPGIGDGKLLVTNSGDDSVSFLDPESLEPVYKAPVGRIPAEREGPHHGAAFADGSAYFIGLSNYVPGSGTGPHGSHGLGDVDGYLLEYSTVDNRLIGEVRVDRSPGDVRLTPDQKYVLQSHFDLKAITDAVEEGEDPRLALSTLAVVNAETMQLVAKIPVCPASHGIAVSADGSEAYVACYGTDELAVVSLQEPITRANTVERYPVGPGGGDPTAPAYGPYAVMVSPATGEVWVSNVLDDSLAVWDPETREFDAARTVHAPGIPFFGDFTSDGSALFVGYQGSESLVKVDPTTGDFESYGLPDGTCINPHTVMVYEGDSLAAVVCEGDHFTPGTVVRVRIDIPGGVGAHEADFEVGVFPDDVIPIAGG